MEQPKMWEKVGSIRKSKSGKQLVLVLNKERYTVFIEDLGRMLDGEREYVIISKPPAE